MRYVTFDQRVSVVQIYSVLSNFCLPVDPQTKDFCLDLLQPCSNKQVQSNYGSARFILVVTGLTAFVTISAKTNPNQCSWAVNDITSFIQKFFKNVVYKFQ